MNDADIRTTFDLVRTPEHGVTWFAKGPDGLTSAGLASKAGTLVRWCEALPAWDHFVCPNPSGVGRKPKKEDIKQVRWWVIDIDRPPNTSAWQTSEDVIDILWKMLDRPFNIAHRKVGTGRGVHIWIPIIQAAGETQEYVDRCIKGATRNIRNSIKDSGAIDLSCADISHVFRLPGTNNSKNACTAGWVSETEGMPATHVAELAPWAIPELPPYVPVPQHGLHYVFPALPPAIGDFLRYGTDEGSRHRLCYAAAKTLHELGVDKAVACGLVLQGLMASRGTLEQYEFWAGECARAIRQIWRT